MIYYIILVYIILYYIILYYIILYYIIVYYIILCAPRFETDMWHPNIYPDGPGAQRRQQRSLYMCIYIYIHIIH